MLLFYVAAVWYADLIDPDGVETRFLDICHTIFVDVTLWNYLILHFEDPARADFISWHVPITEQ
jgi:hypothetical protein